MGRRSINTTKSGKYMNPTDQARKEARKRELKKNKKQRMLVRTAVLKGKDPHQVLADMERLDQMEYNVDAPPPLNEKVLRDKRRKLKETWDRLCRLYAKEDHEKYLELKHLEGDYEAKRNKMIKFYEAVKSTQDVSLDEIPLPPEPAQHDSIMTEIFQATTTIGREPSSILKKDQHDLSEKEPPGLPAGIPPNIDDWEEGELEDNDEKVKKVRFGENEKESDISEFLKEIEDVERTVAEKIPVSEETEKKENQDSERNQEPEKPSNASSNTSPMISTLSLPITSLGPAKIQPAPPSGPPPPVLLLSSGMHSPLASSQIRPGMIPPGTGPTRPGILIPNQQFRPPGPHIGPQPRSSHPRQAHTGRSQQHRKDDKKHSQNFADKATIEAKPQLRNFSADATRFTPLALRVKRSEKIPKKPTKEGYDGNFALTSAKSANPYEEKSTSVPTKDDAYEEFMKELKNII